MIYTPSFFKPKSEKQVVDFIKKNAFGTILSTDEKGELQVSKTPFRIIEGEENWSLEGHLASNNPHIELMKKNKNVVIMFDGTHGYISPMLYKNPRKSVPTWNYSTVLVKGEVKVIQDKEWLLKFVKELSDDYEKDDRWIAGVDKEYMDKLSQRAIGFEIKVKSYEAKFKLNQQTPKAERDTLLEKLDRENSDLSRDMRDFGERSD